MSRGLRRLGIGRLGGKDWGWCGGGVGEIDRVWEMRGRVVGLRLGDMM